MVIGTTSFTSHNDSEKIAVIVDDVITPVGSTVFADGSVNRYGVTLDPARNIRNLVITAKAGIQVFWAPAFARATTS